MMDINVDVLQWSVNCLIRKTSGGGIKNIPNKELAEEFPKPIIRKFNRTKVHSAFKDDIWGADLADM